MAKDGTNRGGRRVRAGDKPMSAVEKIQKGLPVQIMNNDIPELETTELEAVDLPEGAVLHGADMPKPGDYLSARQKNGMPLGADEIYKETWLWLKKRGCENLVNKRLIESYDMLTSADGEGMAFELSMELDVSDEEETADERFTTDYTLASELYKSFIPNSEEAAIQEEWTRYKQNIDEVMSDMESLKTQFPYTAAETLSNPDKLAEYKAGLEHRLYEASKERARLTNEIERMKEATVQHG